MWRSVAGRDGGDAVGTSRRIMVVATLAVGCLWVGAPAALAAAPSMTASSATVAVGGSVDVTVDQCETEEPTGGADPDSFPQVFLVTGSGPDAVRAAIGVRLAANQYRTTVPGWVDPADPAVIAGACDQHFYGHAPGKHWQRKFSYPDVAIDVTPAGGPVAHPTFSTQRSTFEAGQAVEIQGEGCTPGETATVDLDPGTDLAWRNGPKTYFDYHGPHNDVFIHGSSPVVRGDGTFTASVVFNSVGDLYEAGYPGNGSGPLPEGPYALRVGCGDAGSDLPITPVLSARPIVVEVVGTNPSGSMSVDPSSTFVRAAAVTGAGCDRGRSVSLRWIGKDEGSTDETADVAPTTDGTWSFRWDDLERVPLFFADCGDPAATGFRYSFRTAYAGALTSTLEVSEVRPAAVSAGSDLVAEVRGRCGRDVTAAIADGDGRIVASSSAIAATMEEAYELDLTAPDAPGAYEVVGLRGGAAGGGERLMVVAADGTAFPATPISGDPTFTG